MALPQVHGASITFCSRASLPRPHGVPAEAHPAVLAQAQTGECEEVGTYWSNLLPLKSRASESIISLYHIILTILRHNSHSSQRTLGRIKPQVPTGLTSLVMRPGIAILSFHLPFFSGPPFLSPGITSQSKPTASKSLSQTLPFEGTHN